jgi:hypothetical protein
MHLASLPWRLVARNGVFQDSFSRDQGMGTPFGSSVMAFAGVIGALHCPSTVSLQAMIKAVTRAKFWSAGIWVNNSGYMGASSLNKFKILNC